MERPIVELRILGPTELSGSAGGTGSTVLRQPKRLAMLAYLALTTADGYCRRDTMVALFWPEFDQPHARTQLRKVIHALRRTIGANAFEVRGEEEIRLDAKVVWCDAVEFRRHIGAEQWTEALALYRGDLVDGLFPGGVGPEFESWLQDQRAALREQASRAAWEASSRADLAGHRDQAIALARTAVELDPDDEEGIRRLIAALDRCGDRAGALHVFNAWRARMQTEYGAEPAPETRKLARRVKSHRQGESTETPSVLRTRVEDPERAGIASDPDAPKPTSIPRRSARRTAGIAGLAIIIVTLTLAVARLAYDRWNSDSPAQASVAVLPFRPLGDSVDVAIGEGVTDELTAALAQLNGVEVRASVRSHQTLNSTESLREIGGRLRVAHIVEGSVRHDARRLRVLVRLVRIADGRTEWAQLFEFPYDDILGAQERIARAAVQQLRSHIETRPNPPMGR